MDRSEYKTLIKEHPSKFPSPIIQLIEGYSFSKLINITNIYNFNIKDLFFEKSLSFWALETGNINFLNYLVTNFTFSTDELQEIKKYCLERKEYKICQLINNLQKDNIYYQSVSVNGSNIPILYNQTSLYQNILLPNNISVKNQLKKWNIFSKPLYKHIIELSNVDKHFDLTPLYYMFILKNLISNKDFLSDILKNHPEIIKMPNKISPLDIDKLLNLKQITSESHLHSLFKKIDTPFNDKFLHMLNFLDSLIRKNNNIKIKIPKHIKTFSHLIFFFKKYENKLYSENKSYIKNTEFSISKNLRKINYSKLKNFEIIVPKDSYTLILWGSLMENCLADYLYKCESNQCQIIGITESNVLKYILEINNSSVYDIKGKRNHPVKSKIKSDITNFLLSHNIIKYKNKGDSIKKYNIFHNNFILDKLIFLSIFGAIILTIPLCFVLFPLLIFMIIFSYFIVILNDVHNR